MKDYSDGPMGAVDFPYDNEPGINWRHIDGPLLYFSDGQLHWLTLRERIRCWLGWDDAQSLQRKLRPRLTGYLHVMRQRVKQLSDTPRPETK